MLIATVGLPAILWWGWIVEGSYGLFASFRLMMTRQHGAQLPGGEANRVNKPGMGDHDEEAQEH